MGGGDLLAAGMEGKEIGENPQASAGTGAGGPILKPEGASAGKAPGLSGKVCVSGLEGSQKKISSVSETMGWPKCPHILAGPFIFWK